MPLVDAPQPLGGTAEFCPGEIRLAYDRLRSDGFPTSPPSPTNRTFTDRYQMVDRVARGGMGEIWRARDCWFDRLVAVKVLRPELAAQPTARSRFLREARLHARLHHAAVVPVYDLGETPDGRPYLTMKYIDGSTLEQVLANPDVRREQVGELVRAFRRVCQAVAHAHTHRVLHRDIKPHNVMISREGKLRLIDWGLACELGDRDDTRDPSETLSGVAGLTAVMPLDDPEGLTACGAAVGTPGYMAPEQARGEFDRIDQRTDVFGLGALLCEILTGSPPFVAATLTGVWEQSRAGDLSEARERLMRCGADVRLVKLCLKCLAHNPFNRPQDVDAVLARLPTS